MPRTPRRVVCGLGVMGATFTPSIVLRRVDLPTLGLPTIATKPERVGPAGEKSCGVSSVTARESMGCGAREAVGVRPRRLRREEAPRLQGPLRSWLRGLDLNQ